MKDQNKQTLDRQTCKYMVPKCKELPAKERKGDKYTTVNTWWRHRWHERSADKGAQQVQSQGRSHLRKGYGSVQHREVNGRGSSEEVALSSVLFSSLSRIMCPVLCYSGLFLVKLGWRSTHLPSHRFWPFLYFLKAQKRADVWKVYRGQEAKTTKSFRLAAGLWPVAKHIPMSSKQRQLLLNCASCCHAWLRARVVMSSHFFTPRKNPKNPDS